MTKLDAPLSAAIVVSHTRQVVFFQTISLLGAAFLLVGYIGAQTRKLGQQTAAYNLLNLVGSGLLAWVAINDRRAGFIILEVVWALVSVPPLLRAIRAK